MQSYPFYILSFYILHSVLTKPLDTEAIGCGPGWRLVEYGAFIGYPHKATKTNITDLNPLVPGVH